MRLMFVAAVAAASSVFALPADAGQRHYYPGAMHSYSDAVTVIGGYGDPYPNGYYSPFPVSRRYVGRTVNQEYCGHDPWPCHQYSNTFQPSLPPVFIRVR
jgi:hypothetical protein